MKDLEKKLEDIHIRAVDFINSLSSKDRILLLHHVDPDGLISAVLFMSFLEKQGLAFTRKAVENDEKKEKAIAEAKNYDKVILVDVPIEDVGKILSRSGKPILAIDHHSFLKNWNSSKMIYYNPRIDEKEIYQPTAYLTFKILSKLGKMRNWEWLAVLGTIADFGYKDCLDLVEKHVKIKKSIDFLKSRFGKAAKILSGSISVLGIDRVIDILMSSDSLSSVAKNREMLKSFKLFNKEFKIKKKEYLRNVQRFGNVMFAVIDKPKYHGITSDLSTQLATQFESKIIFVLHESGNNMYKVSARNEKGSKNLGMMFEKMGIGGGHRQAAGARIRKEELEKFKQQLKKIL